MSINRNRAKLNKAKNGNQWHRIWLSELYPLYWEEGVNHYPRYRAGYKNSNKPIERYKQRMYMSWKHNRITQWK